MGTLEMTHDEIHDFRYNHESRITNVANAKVGESHDDTTAFGTAMLYS